MKFEIEQQTWASSFLINFHLDKSAKLAMNIFEIEACHMVEKHQLKKMINIR